jgi:hypothetical protein
MSARSILQAQLKQLQSQRVTIEAIDTEKAERDERLARVMHDIRRRIDPDAVPESFEQYQTEQRARDERYQRMTPEWRNRYDEAMDKYIRLLPTGFRAQQQMTEGGVSYTMEYDPEYLNARDAVEAMQLQMERATS